MSRAVVSSLALAAGLLVSSLASAEGQDCATAAENGQRARAAGKLREARDQFGICVATSCPLAVRKDCIRANTEVAASLPSVVFVAQDNKGHDLADVTVSMDGEVLVRRLDGKPVTIDPGAHAFKFERGSVAPVVVSAVVKEGERSRAFRVTLDWSPDMPPLNTEPVPPAPPPSVAPPPPAEASVAEEPRPTPAGQGHTAYPWIVSGIGAAAVVTGAVLLIAAPATPTGCSQTTRSCDLAPGASSGSPSELARRDQAGRASDMTLLGLLVGGGGLAVAGAGVLWHFLEPTEAPRPRAAAGPRSGFAFGVAPWTTGRSSGLRFDARF